MTTLPAEAWQIFAGLIAAIVAGLVSFLVTILTKEQKTSEFRQAWIDALRQDLSDFAAAVILLNDTIWVHNNKPSNESSLHEHLLSTNQNHLLQIECTRVRILLRLNPKEHTKLIDLISRAYQHEATRVDQNDTETGSNLVGEFISESQEVLKHEWKRVKRGELSFLVAKWISILLIVAGCAVAYSLWGGHLVCKIAA